MKIFSALKQKHQDLAVTAYVNMGGLPPVRNHRGKWALAYGLSWVAWFVWLVTWPGCWVGRQIRRAWRARKDIWVHLDKVLGRLAWWKKWQTKRRKKMLERCNKAGHTLMGTLLENGQPGKMCQQCKYIQQITPKEFKTLFRVSVQKAIRKAKDAGGQVMNAEKYLVIH